NIFRHVLETAGDKPFARIDAVAINAGIERRAKTPAPAHHFLETMRGLFKWAKKAGMVKVDPTADVDAPRRKEGPGFPAWSETDVEKYEGAVAGRYPRARVARRAALHRPAAW